MAEELAKRNIASAFIAKVNIEPHLAIERRFKTDILQCGRQGCGRRGDVVRNSLRLQSAGCCQQQNGKSENVTNSLHLLFLFLHRRRGRSGQSFLRNDLHCILDGNLRDAGILVDPLQFLIRVIVCL